MKFDINEHAAIAATVEALDRAARQGLTIYSMHLYSEQEVFDFIVHKVLAQGRRAISDDGVDGNVLLNRSGYRCALGMLVPDDEALSQGAFDFSKLPKRADGFQHHLELLWRLVQNHDTSDDNDFTNSFSALARKTARIRRLNTRVLPC